MSYSPWTRQKECAGTRAPRPGRSTRVPGGRRLLLRSLGPVGANTGHSRCHGQSVRGAGCQGSGRWEAVPQQTAPRVLGMCHLVTSDLPGRHSTESGPETSSFNKISPEPTVCGLGQSPIPRGWGYYFLAPRGRTSPGERGGGGGPGDKTECFPASGLSLRCLRSSCGLEVRGVQERVSPQAPAPPERPPTCARPHGCRGTGRSEPEAEPPPSQGRVQG